MFGFALELKRLDWLYRHCIAHQAVSQLADQDFLGRRGLFQPGCDVDGVAGDQALAQARVAGDHFAGVDPDLVLHRHVPCRSKLDVQCRERRLHLQSCAGSPERIVLVEHR